ncbi:MAG: DUF3108 domain-containing protein [bacterium]|jgi:hypothetical protein|nr:DUF3108 domain-containing protein [Candidatus Neomarinimicrobiota bacterium]
MKKVIILLFMSFLLGQEPIEKEQSFVPGEQYKYNLFVDLIKIGPNLIKLGSATLSTKKIETINGREAYHLNFSVKTSKVGDALYKIRDTIDVWVDTESLQLIKQVKKLREKNVRRQSTTIITGSTAITDGKEYSIPENVFDPYALIMILKNEDIAEKKSKKFTILDDGKVKQIEIQNIGIKTIRTPAGKFDAYTYKPLHNGKSVLKNKGDMQISYGIINNRTVPVKISLKLSKGVIVLKLKKSSNIINE